MAAFLKRKARKEHRRVKLGFEDRRTTALRLAGLELLAISDFEKISIAMLTKKAGCSVGAFYYRYPDKSAYLMQLIAVTFRRLENNFENRFINTEGEKPPPKISLSDFITDIVSQLSHKEIVGVIRAALKLGSTEPEALRYYEQSRARITAETVNLFGHESRKKIPEKRIREAMQILFATINDAVQMPNSAEMELGGKEMTAFLFGIVANQIGVKPESV